MAVMIAYLMSTAVDAFRPPKRQNFFDYGLNGDRLLRSVEQSFGTYGRSYGRPFYYEPFFQFMRSDSFWYFHSLNFRTIDFGGLVRRRDGYLANDGLERRDGEERGGEENKKKKKQKKKTEERKDK